MKMQNWLNARCAQLLREINDTPLSDNCEEIKMKLLMSAMRESAVEMFHRAAENSRKEIDKINSAAKRDLIGDVQDGMDAVITNDTKDTKDTNEADKPAPKIKLKSSVIRRVDSF